jgi:protein-S-isoprenylcysteine O-methyltransferase Ste14
VGFVLGVCSLGLWTWAQVALGALWSPNLMLRKGHRLITTGPYARIRHPLYAGMIGWSYGLGLVSANWIFVILAALVSTVFVLRIPREERMLVKEFGEEYRNYALRTGSIFPKL